MPLRDELLTPIPGGNPAGENLRYAPAYDKIKEARREDDDAPQGEWRRERKLADWPAVIKLTTEAISKKSKDLQLAAWLTEALIKRNGMAGLLDGLQVLGGLVEDFWDNLYPELEDGDAEYRAAPLAWVAEKLEITIKNTPLTRTGFDFYKYKESRAIPTEADAAADDNKAASRAAALEAGKTSPEMFDEAFVATPKAWYVQLVAGCDAVLEEITKLSEICEPRFKDATPTFRNMQVAVEEFRHTAYMLLQKKRETEPDPVETPAAVEAAPEPVADSVAGTAAAPARAVVRTIAGEPADYNDAVERIVTTARYLRKQQPNSPAPYLMLRGFRWGELRAGSGIDPLLLDPPPTEVRQQLKRLSLQGNWAELLEAAETAMGKTYGRGWLDIQRYVYRACCELGHSHQAIGEAIKNALRSFLQSVPELIGMTLMDDTSVASADTMTWLREIGALDASAAPAASQEDFAPAAASNGRPDIFQAASRAVAEGRVQDGLEMLTRELARERSGRGRFTRKVQIAELCLSSGKEAVAFPTLTDVAAEIESRKLDEWESPESVAHPLALLYKCIAKMDGDATEKQRLYDRICRLDPAQAISVTL